MDGRTAVHAWCVFDVDGTLVDALTGCSLRPGAHELLGDLAARKYGLVLWSAGGAEYAARKARFHHIHQYFGIFAGKQGRDGRGFYTTDHVERAVDGDLVFVDDQPADIPPERHCIAVPSYLRDNPHDTALASLSILIP